MNPYDPGKRRFLAGALASGTLATVAAHAKAKASPAKASLAPPLSGYNDDYRKPFTEVEYKQRLQRLRRLMADAGIDILNVSSPSGMCYLHGYAATWYMAQSPADWIPAASTFVHVDRDELIHFDSDFEQGLLAATSIVKDPVFVQSAGSAQARMAEMLTHLKARGWLTKAASVGLELYSFTPPPAVSMSYQAVLRSQGFKVLDGTAAIRAVQKVKSAEELAYIRQAVKICEIGHRAIVDSFQDGITQLELWGNALQAMYKAGGEPAGLNQGVVSGSLFTGHGIGSTRRVRKGEMFVVDLCGVVRRYHGNLLRTYFAGDPPKDLAQRVADSAGAYLVLASAARSGTTAGRVVAELARYYRSTSMSRDFNYLLGYELGISFPPDWVNEWYFTDADAEPPGAEKIFEARTVTNFESMYWYGSGPARHIVGNVDTLIYEGPEAQVLGSLPRTVISVG